MEEWRAVVEEQEDFLTTVSLTLLKLLVTFSGIALGLALLIRIIGLIRRPPELVIDGFGNASGKDELDAMAPGITQQAREKLAAYLESVRAELIRNRDLKPSSFEWPTNAPTPDGAQDQRLEQLLTSLKEIAPSQLGMVVQLINLAFPPRGTKVTGTLQRVGDAPGRLGIAFEITDLRGDQKPELRTMWEKDVPSVRPKVKPPHAATTGVPAPATGRARAYFRVAQALAALKMHDAAIQYLQKVLRIDTTFPGAAGRLQENVADLGTYEGAVRAYTVAQQLQERGLIAEAITSYQIPLPDPGDRRAAGRAWSLILYAERDRVSGAKLAEAYLCVARLYRRRTVALYEHSHTLYTLAERMGSHAATVESARLRRMMAAVLTVTGIRLHDLGEYAGAEVCLEKAIDWQPDDEAAKEALARVRQSKPPADTSKAQVEYELGRLYHQRGDHVQARTHYEAALEQKPDHTDAREGFREILWARGSLTERYYQLLQPAALQLSLDLARRQMLTADVDLDAKGIELQVKRRIYRAKTYNFLGAMSEAYGADIVGYEKLLYELAVWHYLQAISAYEEWYQPHENVAYTYSLLGRENCDTAYHFRAIDQYEMALSRVDRRTSKEVDNADPNLVKVRITIGLATSQLLTRDAEVIDRAARSIEQITACGELDREKNARMLYLLGAWYALAYGMRQGPRDSLHEALRYIGYAFIREIKSDDERRLWSWADRDPDLAAIRPWLAAFKRGLRRKLDENRNLPSDDGHVVKPAIDAVLTALPARTA
ncbi:MAG: hypothetical protein AB7U18_13335 [Dehalococcoidia bacterium]